MEQYSDGSDASLYSIALVKKNTTFNIGNLLGKKSCHTSASDILSYQVPLHVLNNLGHLQIQNCDFAHAAGND